MNGSALSSDREENNRLHRRVNWLDRELNDFGNV